MQDGIPIGERGRNERGTFNYYDTRIQGILSTHAVSNVNTYTGNSSHARDGDKDTSKAKTLRPTIIYYLQALKQFYL